MASLKRLEEWSKIVEDQRQWIKDHGSDILGYVKHYGSIKEEDHFGDGGEAIYEADMAALRKYEESLRKAEASFRRTLYIPGTCGSCGRSFVDLPGGRKGCVVHNPASPLSVAERVEVGAYKNRLEYTTSKTELGKRLRDEYRAEESRLVGEFRRDLFEEHGVQDNPKAGKVYEKAWEQGHASGLAEVAICFADLVELIK